MGVIINPANLSRNQIEDIAETFAKVTNYIPGVTDIRNYVSQLGGTIEDVGNNEDSSGGTIEVRGTKEFTIKLFLYTSPKRKNFTIAHELGHYVLHSRLGQEQIIAQRNGNNDLAEREANSFAAAFLMPETEVRKSFNSETPGIIGNLAEKFNVSITAMEWRCRNLKLI